MNLFPRLTDLDNCRICPRSCGVNRNSGEKGYCRSDAGYQIASICIHQGEEPVISGIRGICNIFFSGCNLNCLFCQNYQISQKNVNADPNSLSLEEVTDKIIYYLRQGVEAIGFVSPTHFIPHVCAIIENLHDKGYFPIVVYNTNCFDNFQVINSLEGLIDVYLPDFKYMDPNLAMNYSEARTYPEVAKKVLKEMFRQKGSTLVVNDHGQAVTGLIIRHLVLPGQVKDSINILEWIAGELSVSVHISLMSQYYPTASATGHPLLGRKINGDEYLKVTQTMERLGFYKGWIQEHGSAEYFRPDFTKTDPFKV